MLASRESFPLLAELLADQQRLDTPVARFADSVQFQDIGNSDCSGHR